MLFFSFLEGFVLSLYLGNAHLPVILLHSPQSNSIQSASIFFTVFSPPLHLFFPLAISMQYMLKLLVQSSLSFLVYLLSVFLYYILGEFLFDLSPN